MKFLFIFLTLFVHNAIAASPPHILVIGDSLSAGYGLPVNTGWVTLLQKRLDSRHYPHKVINASISGDTTANGYYRLPPALEKHKPEIVIIELGGNDGLRGFPINTSQQFLSKMIQLSKQHTSVLLIGIEVPPNYGPDYTTAFRQMYIDLSNQYKIPLVPFLLENIATHAELMQADGIHPTVTAQALMLDNVWSYLTPLLGERE